MKIRAEEIEETKISEKGFNFNAYLAEGWMHKAVDEAEDSDAPKVGTKATDYAGEEVDIIDVLKLPAKQRDLDWFLDQYDDSGIMRDCYRDPEGYGFDPDEYDYYVAVEHPNQGTAVYVWGPEGVCYSGEDLKEGCHKIEEVQDDDSTVDVRMTGFDYSRGFVCSGLYTKDCKVLKNSLPKSNDDLADVKIEVDPEYEYDEKFLEMWEHPEFEEFFILKIESEGKVIYDINADASADSGLREELEYILKDADASDYPDVKEALKQAISGDENIEELKREPKQATRSDLKGFATKSATLDRAKRAEKGNWKNSVGEFVEKHSAEIGNVSPLGKAALVNYIETKMKPELSDEAKEKVDELVNSSRSVTDLMFALYNTMLKGAGMGLHEEQNSSTATKIKLSELTYDYLKGLGLSNVSMHTDASDALRSVGSEAALERAKKELSDRYGDVEIRVDPKASWFSQIEILDPKFQEDLKKYIADKAAWCSKYGCD